MNQPLTNYFVGGFFVVASLEPGYGEKWVLFRLKINEIEPMYQVPGSISINGKFYE